MKCWLVEVHLILLEHQKILIKILKTIYSKVIQICNVYFFKLFKFLFIFILVILEKTIRIPRSLSVKAASVLKGFLNKNPIDRLGCNRDTGFYDIINHPFFKSIDWEMVSYYYLCLFIISIDRINTNLIIENI